MTTTRYQMNPELEAYLKAQQERQARMDSPEYEASMGASRVADFDAGLNQQQAAGYAKAFSQLGTLRGKSADTSAVSDMANAVNRQQAQMRADMAADDDALDRRTGLKMKTLQYLQDRADQENRAAAEQQASAQSFGLKKQLQDQQQAFTAAQQRRAFEQQKEMEGLKSSNDLKLAGVKSSAEKAVKDPNKEQFDAAAYAMRMKQADDVLENLSEEGYNRTSWVEGVKSKLLPESIQSDKQKRQNQAERNFLTAILRRQSGASISPTEFATGEQQYFPRAGDTAEVLAQKKQNRMQDIESMKAGAGPAWARIKEVPLERPTPQLGGDGTAIAAPSEPKVGEVQDGYEYLGGDPADPKSWAEPKPQGGW